MPKLGLIGYPLSHSFSPGYFADKFEKEQISAWQYDAYPIPDIADFPKLWKDIPDLVGLNVTIPYKQLVIPYLDELDETAAKIGAVNTIKKVGNKLIGYNTDAFGFEASLLELLGKNKVQKALILGTGGASKAVEYVLSKHNIAYQFVSRTAKEGRLIYDEVNADILTFHQLIVNTTPLGMYPNIDNCPKLDYNHISMKHYLLDLVYNPSKTLFLKQGEERGAATMNGLMMLHQQAEEAWRIFY
jgi:shikimate dehydrogenase